MPLREKKNIAIAKVGKAITIERAIRERNKELIGKKIKSDNFTRSNRVNSITAIAILNNSKARI